MLLREVEALRPGDHVLAHDGRAHPVRQVLERRYRGELVEIGVADLSTRLRLPGNQYVLCHTRVMSYGGAERWGPVPVAHVERARWLRRSLTEAEAQLWRALRGRNLGVKFRRQHQLGPYLADFYARQAGLVVEVDGESHQTGEQQAYDVERSRFLEALGLRVLRFTNVEVLEDLDGVLDGVSQALSTVEPADRPDRQWRRAGTLVVGDVLFGGPQLQPVEVSSLLVESSPVVLVAILVPGARSFVTDLCCLHDSTPKP